MWVEYIFWTFKHTAFSTRDKYNYQNASSVICLYKKMTLTGNEDFPFIGWAE